MAASVETPATAEDWARAEALATEYVKRDRSAVDPVQFRRFEYAPFLLGSWWPGGEAFVLIYDDTIHPERGVAALPEFFAFLGAARLRVLAPEQLDRMLGILGADTPEPIPGAQWRSNFAAHEELYPVVVETDGTIKYVMHYLQGAPAPLPKASRPHPPSGRPPPPVGRPPGGGPPPGVAPLAAGGRPSGLPLNLQRWSLQLYPPLPDVRWRLEGTFDIAR